MVIDVDVSTLFQQQIAISLGLPANATIFEICTAIDAQGLYPIRNVIPAPKITIDQIINAQVFELRDEITSRN